MVAVGGGGNGGGDAGSFRAARGARGVVEAGCGSNADFRTRVSETRAQSNSNPTTSVTGIITENQARRLLCSQSRGPKTPPRACKGGRPKIPATACKDSKAYSVLTPMSTQMQTTKPCTLNRKP